MAEFKKYGGTSVGPESLSDAERPSDNLEIDEIMAKLEQVQFFNNKNIENEMDVNSFLLPWMFCVLSDNNNQQLIA